MNLIDSNTHLFRGSIVDLFSGLPDFSETFILPKQIFMLCYLLGSLICIMAHEQVERLLSAEQKATDYRSPEDGIIPDHRPTSACTRYFFPSFREMFFGYLCCVWPELNLKRISHRSTSICHY